MVAIVVLATGASLAFWALRPGAPSDASEDDLRVVTGDTRIEGAPMCPWRDPDADLSAFFGGTAAEYRAEIDVRVLSGLRSVAQQQLGRLPTGEENALQIHRIHRGPTPVGNVLVRRVKGGSGAIEIVLATNPDRQIAGIRVQRQREPEVVAASLTNGVWLARFRGRTLEGDWSAHGDLARAASEPAADSTAAILEGVRTLLVLLEVAEDARAHRLPPAHPEKHPSN